MSTALKPPLCGRLQAGAASATKSALPLPSPPEWDNHLAKRRSTLLLAGSPGSAPEAPPSAEDPRGRTPRCPRRSFAATCSGPVAPTDVSGRRGAVRSKAASGAKSKANRKAASAKRKPSARSVIQSRRRLSVLDTRFLYDLAPEGPPERATPITGSPSCQGRSARSPTMRSSHRAGWRQDRVGSSPHCDLSSLACYMAAAFPI